tara:strand:+ start:248 stop:391 length:144 start_codon:yes stop_codon:yes gene_type:complete
MLEAIKQAFKDRLYPASDIVKELMEQEGMTEPDAHALVKAWERDMNK